MEFDENLNRLYGAEATIQKLKYRVNIAEGDIAYLGGGQVQPFTGIDEAVQALRDVMEGLNANFEIQESGGGLIINDVIVWEGL